jgi:hypothetical protein
MELEVELVGIQAPAPGPRTFAVQALPEDPWRDGGEG